MKDSPKKIEELKARWMLDPNLGLVRPALIEALRALQEGKPNWQEFLEDVPFTHEIEDRRDLRGVDFSSLRGMGLQYMRDGFIDLRDVDFYRTHLEYSNLYRVHLEDANLYSAFLDGASLRNTHLRGAVIEYVSLENAQLHNIDLRGFNLLKVKHLSTVDLSEVRLTDAIVDREQFLQPDGSYRVYNEVKAFREFARVRKNGESAPHVLRAFDEAREVYLSLKNNFLHAGKYQHASWAACKEKEMEKLVLVLHLHQGSYRGWQAVQKRLEYCGYNVFSALFQYGENPWRLLWWALAIMLLCTLLYPLSGLFAVGPHGSQVLSYAQTSSLAQLLSTLLYSLYASVITFTTVGFGDVTPVHGFSQLVAAAEALSGMLFFGLFVFTLGRKVSAR